MDTTYNDDDNCYDDVSDDVSDDDYALVLNDVQIWKLSSELVDTVNYKLTKQNTHINLELLDTNDRCIGNVHINQNHVYIEAVERSWLFTGAEVMTIIDGVTNFIVRNDNKNFGHKRSIVLHNLSTINICNITISLHYLQFFIQDKDFYQQFGYYNLGQSKCVIDYVARKKQFINSPVNSITTYLQQLLNNMHVPCILYKFNQVLLRLYTKLNYNVIAVHYSILDSEQHIDMFTMYELYSTFTNKHVDYNNVKDIFINDITMLITDIINYLTPYQDWKIKTAFKFLFESNSTLFQKYILNDHYTGVKNDSMAYYYSGLISYMLPRHIFDNNIHPHPCSDLMHYEDYVKQPL